METTWNGFSKPTTTPVPDELFDIWLAALSGSELKVLLYIVRRTFGFKKDADAISLSQICTGITTRDGRELDHGTGLARNTASKAVKKLEVLGLIHVVRAQDENEENEVNTYRLRFQGKGGTSGDSDSSPAPEQGSSESEPGVVRKSNHPGSKNDLPLVRKSNPQQTVVQETDPQQTEKQQTPPPLTQSPVAAAPAREPPRNGDGGSEVLNELTAGRIQTQLTPIHSSQTAHPIQHPPVRERRQVAVDTLVAFGVWRSRARPLVDRLGLTAADADRACEALQDEIQRGAAIASPGAVLARRLEAGWKPPGPEPPPDPFARWGIAREAEVAVRHLEDARSPLPPVVTADGTERDAYQWFAELKGDLQLQLARETFDTWLRAAELIEHTAASGDAPAALTSRLHSLYAHQWVQERLNKVIQRQAERMLGNEVEIHYIAARSESEEADDKPQAA